MDMEHKGCVSIIHDYDRNLWVTMVGWVDVPYSDWGDFIRRRAVDVSNSISFYPKYIQSINPNRRIEIQTKRLIFVGAPFW